MATVIAEFCQNHNGDRGLLSEMIAAAANAGADYAKVQTIYADDLSKRERFENGLTEGGEVRVIKRPYKAEFERLRGLEFETEAYGWFSDECAKHGIKPLTTLFSRGRIRQVASWGWKSAKVASYDCASFPLLRELRDAFDELFVSTGATFDDEIAKAAAILSGKRFSFLHCVTIYPTPLDRLHLNRMRFLRKFTPSVGFSDHTLVARDGIKASAVALHLGADVIERHVTILESDKTKDGPVSIKPDQLRELCSLAHGSAADREAYVRSEVGSFDRMLGSENRSLSMEELLNRDYFRGRFGTRLRDDSFVFNWEDRPLAGLA